MTPTELVKVYPADSFRPGVSMNKRRVFVGLFLFLFGAMPLLNSINNPRTQALHGSDFVQLIASGMCFGVGICVLVAGRKFPGE
jgi:hypothetical protein